MFQLHRSFSKSCGNGAQLHLGILYRRLPVSQLLIPLDMGLLLGGTGPGSPADPFQFHPQDGLAFALACRLHLLTLSLQLQKAGIIGLIAINRAFVDFHNPVAYTVQKIPVMGDHDQCASPFFQIVLQPVCHVIVQMVGGLVQQQNVRRGEQHRNKRQALPLSAGKLACRLVKVPDPKAGHHGLGVAFDGPPVLVGYISSQHTFQTGQLRVKLRVLGQIPDHRMIGGGDGSLIRLLHPCQHF